MKIRSIIVFLLISASFTGIDSLYGQTFKGGLSAGFVASQVSGDESAGYNKPGIFGGPWASFKFRDNWQFQMEIIYIQKGSRENPKDDQPYFKYRLKLNYVDVPLMFRYIYNEKLEFEIGVAYGLLISTYEELNDIETGLRPFNTHNSSLIAGLSYNLNERWSANFRTSNSITPIRKHLSGQTYRFNFGQTNNILSLGLFFRI